jgi:hypothetical protein
MHPNKAWRKHPSLKGGCDIDGLEDDDHWLTWETDDDDNESWETDDEVSPSSYSFSSSYF